MSERVDIVIEQGSTFELSIEWLDDQLNPIDLADFVEARMQVRECFASETAVLDLDSGAKGGIVVDSVNSRFDITAEASQTAAMPAPMLAKYDLEAEFAGGTVRKLIYGNARVRAEVTR